VLAIAVLSTGHRMLSRADAELVTGHGDPDVEPELAARRKTAARS
jgi:hypothetical protein